MKYTLLDLTQNILSSMDSDEVNSINDTVESQQVVAIIKTVYNDILSRSNLTVHKTPFTLTASGDNLKPVLMTKPESITNIDWIKYNVILQGDTAPNWRTLSYLSPEDFIDFSQNLSTDEARVGTMTHTVNGFNLSFNFTNDTAPQFFTSFQDNTIIFDAYDNTVDTTLQTSKTWCYGSRNLEFTETDAFVPELQPDQFALLLNEAKSLAWAELKQTPHPKAERTARRNWVHLGKTRTNIPSGRFNSGNSPKDLTPNFGRK
jgi:hypothetical protein